MGQLRSGENDIASGMRTGTAVHAWPLAACTTVPIRASPPVQAGTGRYTPPACTADPVQAAGRYTQACAADPAQAYQACTGSAGTGRCTPAACTAVPGTAGTLAFAQHLNYIFSRVSSLKIL